MTKNRRDSEFNPGEIGYRIREKKNSETTGKIPSTEKNRASGHPTGDHP